MPEGLQSSIPHRPVRIQSRLPSLPSIYRLSVAREAPGAERRGESIRLEARPGNWGIEKPTCSQRAATGEVGVASGCQIARKSRRGIKQLPLVAAQCRPRYRIQIPAASVFCKKSQLPPAACDQGDSRRLSAQVRAILTIPQRPHFAFARLAVFWEPCARGLF